MSESLVCYCDVCGFVLDREAFTEYYEFEENVCDNCKADAIDGSDNENLEAENGVEEDGDIGFGPDDFGDNADDEEED